MLESTIFQKEYLDKLLKNHSIFKAFVFKPKQQLGNVIPLLNRLSNNYYHWTTESLARLAKLMETGKENLSDYDILIAKDAPAFIKDSLEYLLLWPETRIKTWENDQDAKVKKCLLISFLFVRNKETEMTNIYSPEVYNILHKLSLLNIPEKKDRPQHIIISRKSTAQRRLINEELLVTAFPGYPFEIFNIEDMTFVEQVQLFRNAKTIIAPHGAGLVNLIYVNNDPTGV